MIVDRIFEYMGGPGSIVSERTLALAVKRLERTFARNLGVREEGRRRKTIGGSTPWCCPRRAYYGMTGAPKDKYSARSRIAFLMGDVLQAAVDVLAVQAGVEFAYPNTAGEELELRQTIEGVDVVAHVDHAVKHADDGLIAFDSKSMATYTYAKFVQSVTDPDGEWRQVEKWAYVAQLRFYMWLLELSGLGSGERGAFIGIDKNTGHVAELWVMRDEQTIAMFRRAIPGLTALVAKYALAANAVYETAIANSATHEDAELAALSVPRIIDTGLPPRPVWSRTVELTGANLRPDGSKGPVVQLDNDKERTSGQGFRCGYCPYTEICYPGFELVKLKGAPKWRKALETS